MCSLTRSRFLCTFRNGELRKHTVCTLLRKATLAAVSVNITWSARGATQRGRTLCRGGNQPLPECVSADIFLEQVSLETSWEHVGSHNATAHGEASLRTRAGPGRFSSRLEAHNRRKAQLFLLRSTADSREANFHLALLGVAAACPLSSALAKYSYRPEKAKRGVHGGRNVKETVVRSLLVPVVAN